jgi:hypothetical protein
MSLLGQSFRTAASLYRRTLDYLVGFREVRTCLSKTLGEQVFISKDGCMVRRCFSSIEKIETASNVNQDNYYT